MSMAWKELYWGGPAQDPETLSSPQLQEEKEWCQDKIKYLEAKKARCQAKGWEEDVQKCETGLQLFQQHFTSCQDRLEYKAQELVSEALASEDNREKFDRSKQECAMIKTLSGTMSGFAGVGKTHTLALATREEPPSLRVSTAVSQIPTRTISQTRIGKDGDGAVFNKITEKEFTDSILLSTKESVSSAATGTTFNFKGLRKFVSKSPSVPMHPVERDLMVKFYSVEASAMSLDGRMVLEISDCGGQPQFLEILPRYIESIDFSILVTDLSQRFDQYPINYFFNEEGKSVGEGVRSSLTNEQVIRLHLQMIASLSQGERRPKIAVVGTHRDLEGTCTHMKDEGECKHDGGCFQSREEKNQRLMEMVKSFGLEDSVIFKTHNEIIFPINAKTPEEEDRRTMDQLMNSIILECPPRTVKIPLSYHALELTVKKRVNESGHLAFKESALLKEMSTYHFSKKSFKDALHYLHKKRRVIYYEKVFPGRVLGEPQAVLNKQTELVVYNMQLASNLKTLNKEQWRFVRYGFFNISFLKKFPDHYVEGVFTADDMLKLFVKLLMVSEVKDGEYLMPCVLPTDPLANCNPEPHTQSVPPMVLHFPGGPARYGVFCGTICRVMTKSNWKLLMVGKSDEPSHITRNSVHFHLPGCRNKVTLNDPFDSFFVVTVHVPPDVPTYSKTVSRLCVRVRDTLLEAIAKVTKKLNYTPGPPEVSFLCAEHNKDLHPAILSDMKDELLCTKDENARGGALTTGHKVWLRDSSSIKAYPDLTPPKGPVTPTPDTSQQPVTNSSSQSKDPQPLTTSDQAGASASTDKSSSIEPHPGLTAPCRKHATTTQPPISAKPTLGQLVLLKAGNKQKRITTELGVEWETLALLLEFDPSEIEAIKDDNRGINEKSCRDMLRRWLDGKACQPITWGKLVEAIRDIPRDTLATQVEELLTELVVS